MMRSMWMRPFVIAVVLGIWFAGSVRGAAPSGGPHADLVKASLLADTAAVTPGSSFTLGVKLKIKPHWHTYWINPGDFGEATQVKLRGPAGFEFGAIQWPLPQRLELDSGITYGYENEVMLLIPVKVAADVPAGGAGGQANIEADVSWLVCSTECLQGEAKLSITLPVSGQSGAAANEKEFAAWRSRLPVTMKDPVARQALAHVEQTMTTDREPAPAPGLTIEWKQPPRSVQWFPIATQAAAIGDVAVKHEGQRTRITFAPTIYQADEIPGGVMQSVVVYEDAHGRRQGVVVPIRLNVSK